MFRRVCYELARLTGGTVSEFRLTRGCAPNFEEGIIAYCDRTVAVVHIRDSMLFAVADPRIIDHNATEAGPLTFVDEPALVAALAALPGVRVLTRADLDASFDMAAWPDIRLSDVRYWKPATVGAALFNYWD